MIQIKRWDNGKLIHEADLPTVKDVVLDAIKQDKDLRSANLSSANLRFADLRYAKLSSADLRYANLRSADLRYANLRSANLSFANLYSADLSSANLRFANLSYANLSFTNLSFADLNFATGIIPQMQSSLHMLLEQPAEIRAYKLVKDDYTGPYNGGIVYEVGKSVEVFDANTDIHESCGAGINVATLDWCLKEWRVGYRILVVEFLKEDIACIPMGTDGKFRLHRCKVVREVDLRAELNWPCDAIEKGVE